MNYDEVSSLKSFFSTLEINSKGMLKFNKIQEAFEIYTNIPYNDIEELVNSLNIDGNGFINYSEFVLFCLNWGQKLSKEKQFEIFRAINSYEYSNLTQEEIEKSFNEKSIFIRLLKKDYFTEIKM